MEGKRYPTPILLDKGSVYSNPVRHSVYVYENPDGSRMERTFREAQGFDKGLAEVEEELSEDEVFFGYIDYFSSAPSSFSEDIAVSAGVSAPASAMKDRNNSPSMVSFCSR